MTASASTRSTSTRSCYAPAPPRPTRAGCAALEAAIKGNKYVDGEQSYLDRAMANMNYDYMKLSASRWSYPIAELDGFLAMFPPPLRAEGHRGPRARQRLDAPQDVLRPVDAHG